MRYLQIVFHFLVLFSSTQNLLQKHCICFFLFTCPSAQLRSTLLCVSVFAVISSLKIPNSLRNMIIILNDFKKREEILENQKNKKAAE